MLGNSLVCCTSEQLEKLEKDFKAAETIFGRCPTCTQNMLKSICALICSPNQSRFVFVSNATEDKRCAKSVTYRMDPDYMSKTFDSCKGVTSPSTGGSVMELGCGNENSFTCTDKKWYEFMGNYREFKIKYTPETNKTKRFEYPVKPCNESYPGSQACSCVDCQITCSSTKTEDHQDDYMRRITHILIVLILFTCLIPGFLYFISKSLVGQSKCASGILPIDTLLKKFFTKWGETVSSYPVTVLFLFVLIVIPLGYGTVFIKVTTDPIKLWARKDSQARMEKDYFDSKFGPFYRIEQIFVQPTYQENVST